MPRVRAKLCASSAIRFLVAALLAAAPASALAAAQRTFVASYGSDASPTCSLAAPCRSFNVAIGVTNPGGEVVILDTAAYGVMTINKSIKIIGPSGVYGGISVLGGVNPTTGIVINAGDFDDITLRGLDISGVTGVAPLPDIGIDIQNAGAVHIEKTSIGNFAQDTSACVKLDTAKVVRLYIDDSFLRECRTGVFVNGNTIPAASSVSTQIDNTRIERGKNTVGPVTVGVWVKNHGTMQIRNSTISRETTGVLYETDLDSSSGYLMISDTHIGRATDGVRHTKTANSAYSNLEFTGGLITTDNEIVATSSGTGSSMLVSVKDSQLLNAKNYALSVTNTGTGHNTYVRVIGSNLGRSANGIVIGNSAADPNSHSYLDVANSTLSGVSLSLIDANSTSGAKLYVHVDQSVLSNATTALKTAGTTRLAASFVRSQVHHVTTVFDSGNPSGPLRLDSNHISSCANDFVNNGGNSVITFGNNTLHDIDNLSGFTYITPTLVPPR
jgi:hypothetical protein